MSRIVQEKFEVRAPREPQDANAWATAASARRPKAKQLGRAGRDSTDVMYQELPPGMDTYDQGIPPKRVPNARGGLGSGTQATVDVTARSLREGFSRKPMSPTDDMYTREHNDAFYDTVEVDGVEGFVERNNYLDRL